jgi:signal transduction histidine kinase
MFLLAINSPIYIFGLLLLGATLITGIYNFFSWLQYREKVILAYCLYLLAVSSYIFLYLITVYMKEDDHSLLRYVREIANILTILSYSYFIAEAASEWHRRYHRFFRMLYDFIGFTFVYCLFELLAGIFHWNFEWVTYTIPMSMRLIFLLFALTSVVILVPRMKGPFLNLVKWGAVSYLFFVLIVILGFFTTDQSILGLDQMQWTFIGTFVEITIFSIAMSYKVKTLLARTQEMRNRISKDLHDEVGATLSGVTLMSELASQRIQSMKIEESRVLIDRITQESKDMSEKMNDIVWTINPANDSMEKVLQKIQVYGRNICQSKNIVFKFEKADFNESAHVNMHVRNNIYLISKEAINNAVKYSGATEVNFTLSGKKENFLLRITDNGIGFDPSVEKNGNGLSNMQARAQEMGSSLLIESLAGKGTKLELTF